MSEPSETRTVRGRKRGDISRATRERVDLLKASPGRWCRLCAVDEDSIGNGQMHGKAARWRRSHAYDGCEFRVRRARGQWVLFGRFTGRANTEG